MLLNLSLLKFLKIALQNFDFQICFVHYKFHLILHFDFTILDIVAIILGSIIIF